jgi:hypothetical protein
LWTIMVSFVHQITEFIFCFLQLPYIAHNRTSWKEIFCLACLDYSVKSKTSQEQDMFFMQVSRVGLTLEAVAT